MPKDDAAQAVTDVCRKDRKYAPHLKPGRDYYAIQADELERTTIHRIDIADWIGKRKNVAADFPGAFEYPITNEVVERAHLIFEIGCSI